MASAINSNLDKISQTANPSKTETDRAHMANSFDEFLLLLTTQMKNQDPTEPMDVSQFTNQLVLFSQVEQQLATNENFTKLIGLQQSGRFSEAANYIGRTIDAAGNAGGLANGEGQFAYDLPEPANTVNVIISDGAKRAVFSGQGSTAQGKNLVLWDGKNSFTGKQEPDGTYFITVIAKNAAGETIKSTTMTTGVVTGAEMQGEDMVVTVNGTAVKIEDIKAVRSTYTAPAEESAAQDTSEETTENQEEEAV